MARETIVAPRNPAEERRNKIEALEKKPTRTPAELQEYIRLLEAELSSLREKAEIE